LWNGKFGPTGQGEPAQQRPRHEGSVHRELLCASPVQGQVTHLAPARGARPARRRGKRRGTRLPGQREGKGWVQVRALKGPSFRLSLAWPRGRRSMRPCSVKARVRVRAPQFQAGCARPGRAGGARRVRAAQGGPQRRRRQRLLHGGRPLRVLRQPRRRQRRLLRRGQQLAGRGHGAGHARRCAARPAARSLAANTCGDWRWRPLPTRCGGHRFQSCAGGCEVGELCTRLAWACRGVWQGVIGKPSPAPLSGVQPECGRRRNARAGVTQQGAARTGARSGRGADAQPARARQHSCAARTRRPATPTPSGCSISTPLSLMTSTLTASTTRCLRCRRSRAASARARPRPRPAPLPNHRPHVRCHSTRRGLRRRPACAWLPAKAGAQTCTSLSAARQAAGWPG